MTVTAAELTGLVPAELVYPIPERVDAEVLERLRALPDLTATVSDVLDGLGIRGAVGASVLRPTAPGAIVGCAVTVRKEPRRAADALDAAAGHSDIGEIEGANQARPGDVLVIQGVRGISAMGGLMATMARRQGAIGAVVDGGVRDIAHAREIDFPMWSADVTPVTGKWRTEVREIGGRVTISGCVVEGGDLVIADETGVVFVPRERAAEVCEQVEAIAAAEAGYQQALAASDLPLAELLRAAGGKSA